ncbi:MAG: UvrD-helicase domain-containing protein [Candidatus Hatepunaea meridiana]|nr:UvrD-helicase domain-containing protein [Candidatus Hatepunaea meridiana]
MNTIPRDNLQREKVRSEWLKHSLTVEAGAGTGKTSLLIDRLIALIKLSEITRLVAITFTEKAAAELNDRLRRELERKIISGDRSDKDKYVRALDDIDRAHISTIHAFASSIIRERPFEIGLEPDFEHFEEDEDNDLLLQVLSDKLSAPNPERDQNISLFLTLGGYFSQLTGLLKKLNDERELLPFFEAATPISDPADWFQKYKAKAIDLADTADLYCSEADDKGKIQIEALVARMPTADNVSDDEAWRWLVEIANLSHSKGNQKNWLKADYCRQQKANIKELKEDALDFLDRAKTAILEKLIVWLSEIIFRVEEIKLGNSRLTFQDQLIIANRLLQQSDVLGYFQQSIESLLIDEFQDTDPLQVEIAMRLASAKPDVIAVADIQPGTGRICLVGDPKQSIYRFRRADHRIYHQATEQVQRFGNKVIVSQNFRSSPSIIKFVNDFFTPLWLTEARDGSKYEPLIPDPDRIDPEPAPPVAIIHRPADDAAPFDKIEQARHKEADIIARIINLSVFSNHCQGAVPDSNTPGYAVNHGGLTAGKHPEVSGWTLNSTFQGKWQVMRRKSDGGFQSEPVKYGDIAILFPRMTNIDIYADALADAGIPYNIEKGKGFYLRQIVRDLYNCLATIDNPADKLVVIGALRSSFFGLSDTELVEWKRLSNDRMDYREKVELLPESISNVLEILNRLHSDHRMLPVDRILKLLLEMTSIIPALMSDKHTLIDVGAIENVMEIARKYEAGSQGGLRGFCRLLWGKIEDGGKEEVVPQVGQVDYVRLMTIHAAKGLEFPMVILANLSEGKVHKETLIPDRINKQIEVIIGSKNNSFKTNGYDEACADEEDAKHSEHLRLLYVAMTRARDHLVIPCIYAKEPTGYNKWLYDWIYNSSIDTRCQGAVPDSLSFRLIADTDLPLITVKTPREQYSSTDVQSVWKTCTDLQNRRNARLKEIKQQLPKIHIPSGIEAVSIGESQTEAVFIDTNSDAALLGRALHRYMALTKPVTAIDNSLADYIADTEGISGNELIQLITSCLEGELWREAITGVRLWREAPVTLKSPEGMMRGIVDIIWEDTAGDIHIGDWKSGGALNKEYKSQLMDYAQAIRKATDKKVKSANLYLAKTGKRVRIDEINTNYT